jgi:hypothetical protein
VTPSIVYGFDGIVLVVSEWGWEGISGTEQGRTTLYGFVKSPETAMPTPEPEPTASPEKAMPTSSRPGCPPDSVCNIHPLPPFTTMPTPTTMSTPPCESGHMLFQLEVTTDLFPEDLTWTLQKQSDETYILESGPYTDALTKFSYEACIPSDECYEFRLSDENQDGPCCLNGEGGFTMFLDGEVFATFQYSESVNGISSEQFGECSFYIRAASMQATRSKLSNFHTYSTLLAPARSMILLDTTRERL